MTPELFVYGPSTNPIKPRQILPTIDVVAKDQEELHRQLRTLENDKINVRLEREALERERASLREEQRLLANEKDAFKKLREQEESRMTQRLVDFMVAGEGSRNAKRHSPPPRCRRVPEGYF